MKLSYLQHWDVIRTIANGQAHGVCPLLDDAHNA
jgi:hypothetical protein